MLREFTSKAFDDYCMCIPRMVLQMVMRTLVMHTNLPPSTWVHAVLHAAMLIRLRLIATQFLLTAQGGVLKDTRFLCACQPRSI